MALKNILHKEYFKDKYCFMSVNHNFPSILKNNAFFMSISKNLTSCYFFALP